MSSIYDTLSPMVRYAHSYMRGRNPQLFFNLILIVMIITYRITEGPSKFDLMSSLFDGKIVQFTLKVDEKYSKAVKVEVVSVEAENGSHSSWNLKVFVREESKSEFELVNKTLPVYYNSKTRQGSINLSK